MKAIVQQGNGGPEVLVWQDVDAPELKPGEVLIRTVAAGVNRADILQAAGHYPPPHGASPLIGLEVSGRIEQVADDVHGWSVGDECVALLAGGGYAEFVAVPACQVVPPPPGLDLVTTAGVIEVAATVVSNVGDLLHDGSTFLVHGGTGGIGLFAIQYAKAKGARVAATAGSKEKLALCTEFGCDIPLDYHDDWVAGLKAAEPRKRGADVILDIMGAKYLDSNLKAVAVDGTIVTIGLQGGRKGEIDLALLLNKRATYKATSLRGRPTQQKGDICQKVAAEVWPMIADGRIQPGPQTHVPMTEAAKAHTLLSSGHNTGKIILTI